MAKPKKFVDPTEKAYYEAFKKRLIGLRHDLELTQEQMAEGLGISKDNYKKYEKRSKFPPHLLNKLAIITHRPVEYIVTGHGPNIRVVTRRTGSEM